MESITAKMARFAPRQIATVAIAVIVNAGALPSWRRAKRRLFMNKSILRAKRLSIDSVLQLALVLRAVEMAFRFCDESVGIKFPKLVAADAKAFSRAARSGVRSS